METWDVMTKELKAIYHTMGMLQWQGQNYFGECWIPTADIGAVQAVLKNATVRILINQTKYSSLLLKFKD